MVRTVVESFAESVFSNRANVIDRTEMSSTVYEPSLGHDRRPRGGSAVTDTRGFHESGQFVKRLFDRARRLRRRRQ